MTDRRGLYLRRALIAGAAADLVLCEEQLGVQVFHRAERDGGVCELGFSGLRSKPDYRQSFSTIDAALAHRGVWLAKVGEAFAEQLGRKEARRAALREAGQQLKLGDVLHASWGLEQTNCSYYQVTRVFGTRSVEIREIAKECSGPPVDMSLLCVPIKDRFRGLPEKKRVDEAGRVKVFSWGVWASKKTPVIENGITVFEPDRMTTYA